MMKLFRMTSVIALIFIAGCFSGSQDNSDTSGNAITIDGDGNTGVVIMLPFLYPHDAAPEAADTETGVCFFTNKLNASQLSKEDKIDLALRASQLKTQNWTLNAFYNGNTQALNEYAITWEELVDTNKAFVDFIQNESDNSTKKYSLDKIKEVLKKIHKGDKEKNPNKKVLAETCQNVLKLEQESDKYKQESNNTSDTESDNLDAAEVSLALADTDCGRKPTSKLQQIKYERCLEEKKKAERKSAYVQAGLNRRDLCKQHCDAAAIELEKRLRMDLKSEVEICSPGAFEGKQTIVSRVDLPDKSDSCFCGRAVSVGMRRNCAQVRRVGVMTDEQAAEIAARTANQQAQTNPNNSNTTEQQTQTDTVVEQTTTPTESSSYFCGEVAYTEVLKDKSDICHQNCPLNQALECSGPR